MTFESKRRYRGFPEGQIATSFRTWQQIDNIEKGVLTSFSANMTKKALEKFFSTIAKVNTEEDVKNAYARYFGIDYNTADKHDLYTPQIFFEFKYYKNFHNLKTRSTVLAQSLYYVRRLKYGTAANKPVPFFLCMADQNEAVLTETSQWQKFYDDIEERYDWDLAPSTPDPIS